MKTIIRLIVFLAVATSNAQLPDGFVYVQDKIPLIQIELRYFSSNNFVGEPIIGYEKQELILSEKATEALQLVQQELNKKGLGLKVYDAYRPQRAVDHFVVWASKLNDTVLKQQYYPDVDKKDLFKDGYIASKSSHTRGSTVDITLIDFKTGNDIDMGTPYDFFGTASWVNYDKITTKQKWYRKQLQDVMLKHGFKNYPQEWWHFTLKDEPFPDTYFDFVIE